MKKMKGLNLNAYGVEELNQQEILDNNGGSLLAIGIGLLIVAVCASSCATYRQVAKSDGVREYEENNPVE